MRLYVYAEEYPAESNQHTLGISKAVHGLAVGTAAAGCPTVVLCEGERYVERDAAPNLKVRCFPRVRRSRRSTSIHPRFVELIENLARGNTDDVLFVLNGIFHPGTYAVARVLHKHRLPYVMAPHDPYHPSIFHRNRILKAMYWYVRERWLLAHAAGVQVLDIRHGQWVQRLGIHAPIIESVNGFASTDIIPQESLTWGTKPRPSLVFIGRVDLFNKGLDLLIRAVKQLPAESRPDLTIQGPDWGDRKTLQSLAAKLGLSDVVHFPEANFDRKASNLIAEHDIFCLVSRFEGFGLAAMEAMIAGRVVIVSDVAGIAPHVRASGCGVVVNPDVKSIREGLVQLLRMRDRWREMGLAGRAYVLEKLRWETIAQDTLKQYAKLLTVRQPGDTPVGTLSAA